MGCFCYIMQRIDFFIPQNAHALMIALTQVKEHVTHQLENVIVNKVLWETIVLVRVIHFILFE